ncbi:hypothetical protein PVK06_008780 [Gossypium arboreum]|uniref:Aminotransferase-like plant mobile domain-containing protein n=1 Tax=Gossypium arboreum TaxID=29729 RepID=A0ABR0QL15_GOSAR|nr:hypothetical protein PVK06_008780 [Gossypium arboreum]
MDGCIILLRSWMLYQLPFLRLYADYPYRFLLLTSWNQGLSYVELPNKLRDIQLLLDQRSKEEFEWTPYFDPTIQECILSEFLVNPNIWHVKVSLVVYSTLEMHESDRVLRQFEFRKSIPPIP